MTYIERLTSKCRAGDHEGCAATGMACNCWCHPTNDKPTDPPPPKEPIVNDTGPTLACPEPDCTYTTSQPGRLATHAKKHAPEIDVPVKRKTEPAPAAPTGKRLVIEVEPGVSITLIAPSELTFRLACEMADKHGIPYTTP